MKITDKNLEKLDQLFIKRWSNFNSEDLLEQGIKLLNLTKLIYFTNNNNQNARKIKY